MYICNQGVQTACLMQKTHQGLEYLAPSPSGSILAMVIVIKLNLTLEVQHAI
jgi:hypothetical protein